MVLLRRHYNLRKRNHWGGTSRMVEKKHRVPKLRQSNDRMRNGRNVRPTKKTVVCPRPRRRQTGLVRMKKRQLEREYELECKQRALHCREQALARMERAIARRERAMKLWEKTYWDMQSKIVSRTEDQNSPSKKCPKRKAKNESEADPEVKLIHHFDCTHPKSVTPTIDLTTSGGRQGPGTGRQNTSEGRRGACPGRRRTATSKITNSVEGELSTVKPPSDTMFSGQGSKVQWQKSAIFPMDSNIQWQSRCVQRGLPTTELVKQEICDYPATP